MSDNLVTALADGREYRVRWLTETGGKGEAIYCLQGQAWGKFTALVHKKHIAGVAILEPGRKPYVLKGGQDQLLKLRQSLAGFAGSVHADRSGPEALLDSYQQRMGATGRTENVELLKRHPTGSLNIAINLLEVGNVG